MVNLEDRRVVLYLTDEGRKGLRQAGLDLADTGGFTFDVQEASDYGLWVRVEYQDGQHLLLIRWTDILTMDVSAGEIRTEGFVH